jgi:hypothetical protein
MSVLYTLGGMAPSFQGHGTSAPFSFPSALNRADPLLQRTAKVWTNFQLLSDLVGHTQSVWAVVSVEGNQYLTGALFPAFRIFI